MVLAKEFMHVFNKVKEVLEYIKSVQITGHMHVKEVHFSIRI